MSNEPDDKSIEEVVLFLKNIIQTHKTLRKSTGIVDCNSVLKLFKYETQNADSGFESEPVSENIEPCLIAAAPLINIIFNKELDLILENSLVDICKYIEQTNIDTTGINSKIENILEFTVKYIEFLADIFSNVPFREIMQTFLTPMLINALTSENDSKFNFVMELFQRFGSVEALQECILDIMINQLKTFAESLKNEGVDASFSFHYETDFSRANTLLVTLMVLKKGNNCSFSNQNEEDFANVLQIFAELNDFFSLGFLGYKCLL